MLYIFRIITSLRFYAGIVCMSLFVFIITKSDVFSFRWVPAMNVSTSLTIGESSFVPRKNIQNKLIAITYTNIAVGNEGSNSFVTTSIGSPDGDDVSKALFYTQSLTTILKTDIVWLMKNASEKQSVMQTFLSQWDILLRQASIVATSIQSTLARYNAKLSTCQSSKSDADTRYNQWLSVNNASQVDSATKQATQANQCIAQYTTIIKSNQWVLTRLTNAIKQTTTYITLVRTHQTTILSHPELINSTTPSEILQLQKSLSTARWL